MEISFESRDNVIYDEYCCLVARAQESTECVVPDTDADIAKIAAVQSEVFLRSKDLTPRGVLISGEIYASVLYITEGEEGVSYVSVKKPFSLEYEIPDLQSETLTQVVLLVQGTDVRMINPRKLSVMFDVEGDLSCYRIVKLCVEAKPPEDAPGLHARLEERCLTLPNAVCEKSVSINEQFVFPAEEAPPTRLISERSELIIADCQLIGSKIIVKGNVQIAVCALRDGETIPAVREFTTPFSQIIDAGVESMSCCVVKPEITGAYYDLVDTISGGKALDMELHAVLQLMCGDQQNIRMVTDVYSNLLPYELVSNSREYRLCSPLQRRKIQAQENVSLVEPCGELVHIFASAARLTQETDRIGVTVNLDLLYRNRENRLVSVRRTIAAGMETEGAKLRVLYARPVQATATAEGENLDVSVMLEFGFLRAEKVELNSVSAVVLNEEQPYVQSAFPTLTLVRRENESIWSLAKKYHSSEEKIRQFNEDAENTKRMLLIPKCI